MTVLLKIIISLLFSVSIGSGAVPPPASYHITLAGQNIIFSCAGGTYLIAWTLNDTDTDFLDVEPATEDLGGIVRSNLTLPITLGSTSVQCTLLLLDKPALPLPSVMLTVYGDNSKPSIMLAITPCSPDKEPMLNPPPVSTGMVLPLSFSVKTLPPFVVTDSKMEPCNKPNSCPEYTVHVTVSESNVPVTKDGKEEGNNADKSVPTLGASAQCWVPTRPPPVHPYISEPLMGPESTSVKLGKNATFTCSGKTFSLEWIIDGIRVDLLEDKPDINFETLEGGYINSTLKIKGNPENDNISIECMLFDAVDLPFIYPAVYLTVLGIGPVQEPVFDSSCIQWKKPEFVSDDVTVLMYSVSVSGADLSPLTIPTSNTQYCPEFTPYQEYNVTITPFSTSPNYTGNSSTITITTPGEADEGEVTDNPDAPKVVSVITEPTFSTSTSANFVIGPTSTTSVLATATSISTSPSVVQAEGGIGSVAVIVLVVVVILILLFIALAGLFLLWYKCFWQRRNHGNGNCVLVGDRTGPDLDNTQEAQKATSVTGTESHEIDVIDVVNPSFQQAVPSTTPAPEVNGKEGEHAGVHAEPGEAPPVLSLDTDSASGVSTGMHFQGELSVHLEQEVENGKQGT